MTPTRTLTFALASILAVGLGQAQAETPEQRVHVYNWYDYIGPDVVKNFSRETGIKTVYDVFDSSEMMEGKLMTGGSGYDVVVATNSTLPNLIEAGVLQPLDRDSLPNWSHLDPEILAKLQANDAENRYAVPYLWGTTGIGYNADKVKAILGDDAPVDSWDLVLKEENLEKLSQCGVAMIDAPGEIIPIALNYLGLPPHSTRKEDYAKAEELLVRLKPHIAYFNSSKFITDLANGDICVVVGWAGGVYEAQQSAKNAGSQVRLEYSIPREGAPVWFENLVLLKDAQHPQEGLAFINYMMRPDVIADTSNYLGYPNANKAADSLVTQALHDNPMVYPPREVMDKLFTLEPLAQKLERVRTRVWSKVKSGS
ncbi:polyamine ABC transporter substrate-binding protein [Pseudomonas taiwanensis]|uniref:polyamine ABC transporter substrate-binding protein n=1 Tax=Pseudomonas taiwanensis TaxID=470150 RepID=UPI0015C1727E|nr:polyamine ABC transporter substrate-binding protein [Pseudomonas taiwanensis]NWL75350.1 polyamine ABC transporter substrate-binding protein [Pseudomonas taiwanensis]